MIIPPEHARRMLLLAATTIRNSLGRCDELPIVSSISQYTPSGCFASIHRHANRALRGCVGRINSNEPLLDMVRAAALGVLDDPRFSNYPVTLMELPELDLELSLLSPLLRKESPLDFDPLTEGIYLTYANRSGLFLPQVARETGWTREQLLDRLCLEKMGLPAIAWRDPRAMLQTFTTVILGPESFTNLVASE